EYALCRLVQNECVAFPHCRAAVRLERVMQGGLRAVSALDDDIRRAESAVDVAPLLDRRLAARGVIQTERKRQRLVIDVDQAQRVFGDLLRFGRDRCYLVANETHDAV